MSTEVITPSLLFLWPRVSSLWPRDTKCLLFLWPWDATCLLVLRPRDPCCSLLQVTWLVRLLHQLSVWLTARHQDRLSRLYYGGGVAGRCARLVLAPPTTYYTRNRSLGGGGGEGGCVRVARKHPPRIVLRRLADKHVLGYLVLALLLLSLLGWSYTASLLLMVVLYAAYVAARGLWQQVTDKTS